MRWQIVPLPEGMGRLDMKSVAKLIVGAIFLVLSGCAIYHEPSASLPVGTTRDFSSTSSIALVNGQPSTDRVFFYGRRYGNFHAWTDIACAITKRELERHGLNVVSNGDKSLTLSIDAARTGGKYMVMIETQLVMSAKTSDGYSATYTGIDRAALIGNPASEIDEALTRAIAQMLNDPKMIAFLTRNAQVTQPESAQ